MTKAGPEKVKTEDHHFCNMLPEKLSRMAEGLQKEYLHQLIVKAEYRTAVLCNDVSNLISHVDQANRLSSPTYKNLSI